MKFYDIDSLFTFGKYEGQSLADVYLKDPAYLKYCAENIDEFYISPSAERELKELSRDMNDEALMNVDFDKMSDDEIEKFINGLGNDGSGLDAKDFGDSLSWDENDEGGDFEVSSPFDEFEDGYDEDDFETDNFNDEDFNDGFEELY